MTIIEERKATVMDKRTIKSMIIELKEEGKSFQEIADSLNKEYGVRMTRQAVCGMYRRATSSKAIQTEMDTKLAVADIVNYSELGLSIQRIQELLASRDVNVSIYKINLILSENKDYRKSVHDELLSKLTKMLQNGTDLQELKMGLSYKGEQPVNKAVDSLLSEYATNEIRNKAAFILADVYNLSENKNIISNISDLYKLNLTLTDIGKVVRS